MGRTRYQLHGSGDIAKPAHSWMDHLMVFITGLADLESIALLFVMVLTYLLWNGDRRALLYWLAAAAFALVAGPLLKYGFQIPRPDIIAQAGVTRFQAGTRSGLWSCTGFLSGGALAYSALAMDTLQRRRPAHYKHCNIETLSRHALALSDVLGSIALGLAWISALGNCLQPTRSWRGRSYADSSWIVRHPAHASGAAALFK